MEEEEEECGMEGRCEVEVVDVFGNMNVVEMEERTCGERVWWW